MRRARQHRQQPRSRRSVIAVGVLQPGRVDAGREVPRVEAAGPRLGRHVVRAVHEEILGQAVRADGQDAQRHQRGDHRPGEARAAEGGRFPRGLERRQRQAQPPGEGQRAEGYRQRELEGGFDGQVRAHGHHERAGARAPAPHARPPASAAAGGPPPPGRGARKAQPSSASTRSSSLWGWRYSTASSRVRPLFR